MDELGETGFCDGVDGLPVADADRLDDRVGTGSTETRQESGVDSPAEVHLRGGYPGVTKDGGRNYPAFEPEARCGQEVDKERVLVERACKYIAKKMADERVIELRKSTLAFKERRNRIEWFKKIKHIRISIE